MSPITIYRVDSTTGERSIYLPIKSFARMFGSQRGWEFDEETGAERITHKGQLAIMLTADPLLSRQVASFLQLNGYYGDGERYLK